MRINRYVARGLQVSRRKADKIIEQGQVEVNGVPAVHGQIVSTNDVVKVNGKTIRAESHDRTIMLYKPVGYVCSRNGQGSPTVYRLLPRDYHDLNPVGRLDKNSSGLLIMTSDGTLAHELTHPKFNKRKTYIVVLDRALTEQDESAITTGVELDDGKSALQLRQLAPARKQWEITMSEGRNRQIRRTFQAKRYKVISLHRTAFGPYSLEGLEQGEFATI